MTAGEPAGGAGDESELERVKQVSLRPALAPLGSLGQPGSHMPLLAHRGPGAMSASGLAGPGGGQVALMPACWFQKGLGWVLQESSLAGSPAERTTFSVDVGVAHPYTKTQAPFPKGVSFPQELLQEVRRELQKVKEEIIQGGLAGTQKAPSGVTKGRANPPRPSPGPPILILDEGGQLLCPCGLAGAGHERPCALPVGKPHWGGVCAPETASGEKH
ncbi:hypothetical protein L345_13351, partial [Ophiophagus hannah]